MRKFSRPFRTWQRRTADPTLKLKRWAGLWSVISSGSEEHVAAGVLAPPLSLRDDRLQAARYGNLRSSPRGEMNRLATHLPEHQRSHGPWPRMGVRTIEIKDMKQGARTNCRLPAQARPPQPSPPMGERESAGGRGSSRNVLK